MSNFIWWLLYLFWLEFKFKEHWFPVYRGQWNNCITLPKKSGLLGFHSWQSVRARYVLLGAARDLIVRCLFKYQLFFQIWGYLFRVNRVGRNFSRSRFEYCFFFFCAVSYELDISSFFVKKVCFSVFVLNSVEDKGPRFISGKKFHLMVTVSFPFRIQI